LLGADRIVRDGGHGKSAKLRICLLTTEDFESVPRSQGASKSEQGRSICPRPSDCEVDREKNQFPYERSHDVVENKGTQFWDPTMLLKTSAFLRFSHNVVENI
jgi:hypothetical protein